MNRERQGAACVLCGAGGLREVSDYRYSHRSQAGVLKCRAILRCESCGFVFAAPMPSLDALDHYYRAIYRKGLTNPYRVKSPEALGITPWAASQRDFLAKHVPLEAIRSAVDIGCGYGFLLRGLRHLRSDLRLHAVESDLEASAYLAGYGIEMNGPPVPVDLAISSHSLEHFSDPWAFAKLVQAWEPRWLFLEVPNCDGFSEKFVTRAYDSPHLLFFSRDSLAAFGARAGWELLHIDTYGWPLEREMELLAAQKERMETTLSARGLLNRTKAIASGLAPSPLMRAYRARRGKNGSAEALSEQWSLQGGDRVVLRAVFKLPNARPSERSA